MKLADFKNIIFIGAGQAAEWIYSQTDDIENKLKAVGDLLEDAERRQDSFHGMAITHISNLSEWIAMEDTAVVVAIGHVNIVPLVERLFHEYHVEKTRTFVPNPYTSLRTFMRSDEFIKDIRVEMDEALKSSLQDMFSDKISLDIYRELIDAMPWDKPGDFYELKWFPDIEDLYYMAEDYWNTYEFSSDQKNDEATVLDCGAYIGDSIIPICKTIPQKKIWYYAFEPSPDNLKELYENEQAKALGNNFKVYECGVGNENDMRFYEIDSDSDGGKFVKEAGLKTSSLEIRRLDDLDLEIHGKLYIKMDVEGSELDALKGSEDIIKKERPIMAICMYHRKNDLATIPLYIKSLVDNYNYYLRGGYHTILWAIPKEEGGKIK